MNPTPEQVAQWAREAMATQPTLSQLRYEGELFVFNPDDLRRLVTRAMAEQAEADAKLCENEAWRLKAIAVKENSLTTNDKAIQASNCAFAIRANAPKVTT